MVHESLKVLLIDDDEDDYFFIKELLSEVKDTRYQLDWVGKFNKAKESVADLSYDVCLIDYRLGEKTGLDLLAEALRRGSKVPFILLTGYGDREIDLKAMKSGASDYLVKANLTSQLLERSIRYAIYRKKSEAQIIMQDRMASIGLLASGLAHEIGTPIGVIRGRAELLKTQNADKDTIKKTADIIVGQIDRISKLVKSLLNLARGTKNENLGAVGINRPIDEVLELMQYEFKKNNIIVKNELPSEVRLAVVAQAEPLHQVILNLLINSVHAIEAAQKMGRGTDHFIRISATSNDENWVLNFEDSGCGIPKSNMTNIFKPFFTTKDIGVGTGLGLATSYNIVESWGGWMSVTSQEGQGTTFSITLPKAK
jgi:two-component system, NtrC family, sensor kinase